MEIGGWRRKNDILIENLTITILVINLVSNDEA
jgi:hypothetical protein